ncbi:MAG: hypothetical protein CV045_02935 [Cyanobacteria bacterium M5B4]|nr:MAG: hypothetical protein CV045_02935 [Cyanobacteria bacterium M5B4]
MTNKKLPVLSTYYISSSPSYLDTKEDKMFVSQKENKFFIFFETPGASEKEIEVCVRNKYVSLKAKRSYLSEFGLTDTSNKNYNFSVTLPKPVIPSTAQMKYVNGVVIVEVETEKEDQVILKLAEETDLSINSE